jgi:hypothetical protein
MKQLFQVKRPFLGAKMPTLFFLSVFIAIMPALASASSDSSDQVESLVKQPILPGFDWDDLEDFLEDFDWVDPEDLFPIIVLIIIIVIIITIIAWILRRRRRMDRDHEGTRYF